MTGTGKNGTGRRFEAIQKWFSSLLRTERNAPGSVSIRELNYLYQFKRSGGI